MKRIFAAAMAMAFVPVAPLLAQNSVHQDSKAVAHDKEAYARDQKKLTDDHAKTVKDYYALGYAKRDAAAADAYRKNYERAAQTAAAQGNHAGADSYRKQADEQRRKFAEAQHKIGESQHAYDEDMRREQADRDHMTRAYNNAVTNQQQLNADQQTLNRAKQ